MKDTLITAALILNTAVWFGCVYGALTVEPPIRAASVAIVTAMLVLSLVASIAALRS